MNFPFLKKHVVINQFPGYEKIVLDMTPPTILDSLHIEAVRGSQWISDHMLCKGQLQFSHIKRMHLCAAYGEVGWLVDGVRVLKEAEAFDK